MKYMVMFLAAAVLLALALTALVLEKTYFYLPLKELKRQAAQRDPVARMLYRAAAYDADLKVFLWLVVGTSAAGGFVLFARLAPAVLGFVAITLVLLLAFIWLPRSRLTAPGAQIAIWCTPAVVGAMRALHPVLRYVSVLELRHVPGAHTGIYEREDLQEFLEQQQAQADNRISEHDLSLMRRALAFGDHRVHEAMTPQDQVVMVPADEQISLVLLDELHKSGHSHFPVYAAGKADLVGTLALGMVADVKREGTVRDFYDRRLAYVHENDRLEQALLALYETGQHILIVVDGTGDWVGILTLGDILNRLFGVIRAGDPGRHEDRGAVAMRHKQAAKAVQTVSKPSTEVVE